jgi:hypothetical protein
MGKHGRFNFRILLSKFLTHNNCLPTMFADIYMLAQGFGWFWHRCCLTLKVRSIL